MLKLSRLKISFFVMLAWIIVAFSSNHSGSYFVTKREPAMPFILIKGTFHVTGYSPDGDSIRFKAKQKANWKKLGGKIIDPNDKGHVQLRVEGIDSLETHYKKAGYHQPKDLAYAAGDKLMSILGIKNVQWSSKQRG